MHYSSGVANHFAYLLAEGTGPKTFGGLAHDSTTCNGTTLQGIGQDKVGKIWYRALTMYMTTGTTYAQARTATLNAATDLYGAAQPGAGRGRRRLDRRERQLTPGDFAGPVPLGRAGPAKDPPCSRIGPSRGPIRV